MGRRKQRVGVVVSDKMQKTIVVVEERLVAHPLYHKYVRRRAKYYVHDEAQQARVGDLVRIEETRPLSKLKRWRLVEIVRRAQ
jgi:small subunit ribosomal protein S17